MDARDEAAVYELIDRAAALRRDCRRLLAALARTQRRIAAVRNGSGGDQRVRLAVERKPR